MKRYIDIIIVLIVFSLGIATDHYFFPQIKIKETIKEKEKIVYVDGKTQTNTIIKYIPKEINPITGQREDTDVELNIPKSQINIKLNNKPFVINPDFDEDYKFENGKLVFNQQSSFDLNVSLPKPERKIELGGYVGLDGFGGVLLIPKENGSNIIMGGPHYDLKGWDLRYGMTF